MQRIGAGLAVTAFLAGGLVLPARAQDRTSNQVVSLSRAFLDAYGRGERDKVLSQIDPDIVVYGSDVAEVFHGVDGVKQMMQGDQNLWRGPATIGEMQNVSVISEAGLAVMTFQAPFVLGSRPPVLVRFSMVWKHHKTGWRLIQSANSVPTVGQSAEELLKTPIK